MTDLHGTLPNFGDYGSARFALTSPTCEPRPFRDYLLLSIFLPLYCILSVATRLAPRIWRDPRPFMCPICFWAGTWGGLESSTPYVYAHGDDSFCPRCESDV